MTWAEEMDILKRAIVVRKQIGVLHAEEGRYWLCPENECDPHGSRVRVSPEILKTLVEEAEVRSKKPLQREGVYFASKIHIA
jgi:hypothetical protein